jgi:hypothetical protein
VRDTTPGCGKPGLLASDEKNYVNVRPSFAGAHSAAMANSSTSATLSTLMSRGRCG